MNNNIDLYGLGWIDFEEAKSVYDRCYNRKNGKKVQLDEIMSPEQASEIEAQAFFHTFRHTQVLESRPWIKWYIPEKQDNPNLTDYQQKLVTLYRMIDTSISEGLSDYTIDGLFDLESSLKFCNREITDRMQIRIENGPFFYINIDNHKPNTKFSFAKIPWDDSLIQLNEKNVFVNGPVNFLLPSNCYVLPVRGVTEIINVFGNQSCRFNREGKHKTNLTRKDYTL